MADMTVAYSPSHGLGEEQSIWFKLTPLLNQENPMQVLMALSDKYGGVIPINLKNQRIVLLVGAGACPARAGRQRRQLRQIFRRAAADLRQEHDHRRRRAVAEDPRAAAARLPPGHVRGVLPLSDVGHQLEDGALGEVRLDRRDHRDGGGDLDARRRDGVQGAVRPRDAVQPAFRLRPGQDLHRRDEPQVDPPQEGARRARRRSPRRMPPRPWRCGARSPRP